MSFITDYSSALVELESGGWDDIPDEYVLEILNNTLQELLNRGYEIGCQEYSIDSLPTNDEIQKIVEFNGRA
jgi:hypothetical protein